MSTYRVTGTFTMEVELEAPDEATARQKAFTKVTVKDMMEIYGWVWAKPAEMVVEEL